MTSNHHYIRFQIVCNYDFLHSYDLSWLPTYDFRQIWKKEFICKNRKKFVCSWFLKSYVGNIHKSYVVMILLLLIVAVSVVVVYYFCQLHWCHDNCRPFCPCHKPGTWSSSIPARIPSLWVPCGVHWHSVQENICLLLTELFPFSFFLLCVCL